MTKRREGHKHVQIWLSPEISARLDAALARIPYELLITSIGERGFELALDELERAFPLGGKK